jgi:hypothetical protein
MENMTLRATAATVKGIERRTMLWTGVNEGKLGNVVY